MSDLTAEPESQACASGQDDQPPCLESHPMRGSEIAPGFRVRRALPLRQHRLVGPWCFLDEMGPLVLQRGNELDVPPHPHIGLQTATWLIAGEILHRDGLGSEQLIRPGQLNLMTAGRGIAHSEQSTAAPGSRLHGVQLWIALPEAHRHDPPRFEHCAELPLVDLGGGGRTRVFAGELGGERSPARVHSACVGAEVSVPRGGRISLPLEPGFEHALVLVEGALDLESGRAEPGLLHYLGRGRSALEAAAPEGAVAILVGGAPFGEPVLMWWNFVARTADEIAAAREDWQAGRRFAPVRGYPGDALEAPPFRSRFA